MVAIGIAASLMGYSILLYGWILIKGYDIGFKQLFSSTWPPQLITPPVSKSNSGT